MNDERRDPPTGAGRFQMTRRSGVPCARDRVTPCACEALAALFETYWYPLDADARRRGLGVERAQDLTRAFFGRLLEEGDFGRR